MNNCVQRSFTSATCPGAPTFFFKFSSDFKVFLQFSKIALIRCEYSRLVINQRSSTVKIFSWEPERCNVGPSYSLFWTTGRSFSFTSNKFTPFWVTVYQVASSDPNLWITEELKCKTRFFLKNGTSVSRTTLLLEGSYVMTRCAPAIFSFGYRQSCRNHSCPRVHPRTLIIDILSQLFNSLCFCSAAYFFHPVWTIRKSREHRGNCKISIFTAYERSMRAFIYKMAHENLINVWIK